MALNPNILPVGPLQYDTPFMDAQAVVGGTAFAPCRAIYNGTATQTLAITFVSGNKVSFVAVPVGTVLPVAATLVDAVITNVLALY